MTEDAKAQMWARIFRVGLATMLGVEESELTADQMIETVNHAVPQTGPPPPGGLAALGLSADIVSPAALAEYDQNRAAGTDIGSRMFGKGYDPTSPVDDETPVKRSDIVDLDDATLADGEAMNKLLQAGKVLRGKAKLITKELGEGCKRYTVDEMSAVNMASANDDFIDIDNQKSIVLGDIPFILLRVYPLEDGSLNSVLQAGGPGMNTGRMRSLLAETLEMIGPKECQCGHDHSATEDLSPDLKAKVMRLAVQEIERRIYDLRADGDHEQADRLQADMDASLKNDPLFAEYGGQGKPKGGIPGQAGPAL